MKKVMLLILADVSSHIHFSQLEHVFTPDMLVIVCPYFFNPKMKKTFVILVFTLRLVLLSCDMFCMFIKQLCNLLMSVGQVHQSGSGWSAVVSNLKQCFIFK